MATNVCSTCHGVLIALGVLTVWIPPCDAADTGGPFAPAIELAQQRTVKVFGAGIGRTAGYATGIIVGRDGQILTAQGVFLGADNLRVTLPNGNTHPATI